MLQYPQIDPVALQIGPISVHWYGLMYLVGFAQVWLLGRWRIRQDKTDLSLRDLEDLIFYCVLGVIVGGRLISEARRVGKECVRTYRFRWSPVHEKKK